MDDFSSIVNNLIKEDDEGVAFHALSSNCLVIFGFVPVGSEEDHVSEQLYRSCISLLYQRIYLSYCRVNHMRD